MFYTAFFEKSLQAGLISGEDYVKVFEALIDYYYRQYKKGVSHFVL